MRYYVSKKKVESERFTSHKDGDKRIEKEVVSNILLTMYKQKHSTLKRRLYRFCLYRKPDYVFFYIGAELS